MKIGVGILGVALVATLGDYTWYTLNVRHSIATGIIHGAVLLTAVGAVLGLDAGRVLKGLPIGALSGIGGALIYYLLVALVDRRTYGMAIPASWVAMWLLSRCSMAAGCAHLSGGRGERLRSAGCSPRY